MRIVDIRERTVPIASSISNAYINFNKMTLSVVAVVTDVMRDGKPVVGYGFNSNGRYGQGSLIRERFRPRVLEANPDDLLNSSGDNIDPHKVWDAMFTNEKPGGHGERSVAIGTIDMAVWDAVAKIAEKPLFRMLAERHGNNDAAPRIFVYAAGGYYYPNKGIDALQDEMRRYLDLGYTVVKMKIGGAPLPEDLKRIEGVLSILGDGQKLAVDANGRFDHQTAMSYAKALSSYDLFWYEEAGDPLDYQLQADLADCYQKPLATGENLFSMQDARNLIRHGGLRPDRDILQFDPALSYGLVEYLRTLEMLKANGWSPRRCVPHGGHQFALNIAVGLQCGGMRKDIDWLQFDCALAYGLVEYLRILDMIQDYGWSLSRCIPHGGHQMSLNIAAGLRLAGNESYPDLFQPYGGFPDGVRVESGYVRMPELPGIGFEGKQDLHTEMTKLLA